MLAEGRLLSDRDISQALPAARTTAEPALAEAEHGRAPFAHAPTPARLRDIEFNEIQRALAATRGNKAAAARRLGVTRRFLYHRLQRYGSDA
jgi:DNA-binding NtrC family response regulator